MFPYRRAAYASVLACALSGCSWNSAGTPPPADPPGPVPLAYEAGFVEIADSISEAADVEGMLTKYRSQIEKELAEVVGLASGPFVKADPEGALDNLVADAVLHTARRLASDTVHAVLLNDGGLRVPLAAGPLRMTHAFELLPFRNYVIILSLTGEQMERLADEIAASNGEPVAGWTMALDGRDAVDVRIGGEPVRADGEYRLATVDYLADGGGTWSVLWEVDPEDREDLGLLIRDAFVDYVRERGEVAPLLDGRIRPAGANEGGPAREVESGERGPPRPTPEALNERSCGRAR